MKRSWLALLAVLPAILSALPAELIGAPAIYLQRLPVLGPNGLPYWEPILFLIVVTGFVFSKPRAGFIIYLCAAASLLLATVYFLGRASGPLNQNLGLFLQFCSLAAFAMTATSFHPLGIAKKLERPLIWGGAFVLALSVTLTVTAFGISGWWGGDVVQIARFEGLDERTRWSVVRPQSHLLMAFLISYCTVIAFQNKRWWMLILPFLFALSQIVQSSRGGIVLVVAAAAIGFSFAASKIRLPIGTRTRVTALATVVTGLALALIVLNERARFLLSTATELTAETGIRNRMYSAAWALYSDQPVFGVGYIDLYSTPEWGPFVLPHMLLPLHNMYVQALLYHGIIGAMLWIIPTILAFRAAARLVFRAGRVEMRFRPVVAGLVGLVPAFLYMMIFQTLDRVSLILGWIVLGTVVSIEASMHRRNK